MEENSCNDVHVFILLYYITGQLGRWRKREKSSVHSCTSSSKFLSEITVILTNTNGLPFQPSKKKGKKLEEKIAERERKAKEEAEQKRMLRQENMTPEERLADKLYRQKLVEESDFEMARETFGEYLNCNQ